MRRFAIEQLLTPKNLRIVLFALCGAFAITAAVLFLTQWFEGETAARNAEVLLDASGIKSSATAPESIPGTQPTADRAESELPPELKGFSIIARLDIETLNLHLPVLSQISDKALKVFVCYYDGPAPGEKAIW